MKYIYYILMIVIGLSAIIGYELGTKRKSPEGAALIINDRTITTEEFNRLYSLQSPRIEDRTEFINSLITKELLIQESQKEGIDKEESFRRSIQNFYEQSLIKLLIDRKFSSLRIDIGKDELDKYISFLKKRLHLIIFTFDTLEGAGTGRYHDSEKKIVYFDELSDDIKDHILQISEGETTAPIRTGEKYITVRLDKIEPVSARNYSPSEVEGVRKILMERRKERIMNEWIADLRKKASITILMKDAD
ncbi:MAG: hypothetical protein AB1390_07705 [Nitrospirota bacterium]